MATATTADIVRIGAKLYAENPGVIVPDDYVPLFHGWIQRRALDGTPIDVADYKHVPDGPGIMLIGHEADRSLDFGEGRAGVVYQRKREGEGTLEERFAAAAEAADRIAADIEADPAANGVSTVDELRPAILAALGTVRAGRDADIARVEDDPKGPLTIRVRLS